MTLSPVYSPIGDQGVRILLDASISEKTHVLIQSFIKQLKENPPVGVIEAVPSYGAVTVYYDSTLTTYDQLLPYLDGYVKKAETGTFKQAHLYYIPVCYEEPYAPDMEKVIQHTGLNRKRLIAMHTKPDYRIFMMGFTPGFPYLGGMDERLAVPRLETPRSLVKAGSVGIANKQTGIYSITSPGGWNIIGRSPISLFDKEADSPILLQAGDFLNFYEISAAEYRTIKEQVKQKNYTIRVKTKRV